MEIFNNQHIWTSAAACITAQISKGFLDSLRTKKINTKMMLSSGGMPSSHSALVCALTVSIGISEGLGSTYFALSAAFAILVMYDAAGVRRAAGKHAEVINSIMANLETLGAKPHRKLKELLGHTPIEVFGGAIWGVGAALIANFICA